MAELRLAREFGQMVRQRRVELKLTQVELAARIGTAPRFIGDLENGKHSCQLGLSLAVAETLGMQARWHPITAFPQQGSPS